VSSELLHGATVLLASVVALRPLTLLTEAALASPAALAMAALASPAVLAGCSGLFGPTSLGGAPTSPVLLIAAASLWTVPVVARGSQICHRKVTPQNLKKLNVIKIH
jgi:hypothetical protein